MNSSAKDQLCKSEDEQNPESHQNPEPHQNSEPRKNPIRKRRPRQSSKRVYEGIPINMVEARKEIINELKLHRASTKLNQDIQQPFPPKSCPCFHQAPQPTSIDSNPIASSVYLGNDFDFSHPFSSSSCPIISPRNLNFDSDFKTMDTFLLPSSNIYVAPTHKEVILQSISSSKEEGKKVIMDSSNLFWSNNNISTRETEKEIQEAMSLEIDDAHHSFHKPIEFSDGLSINDDFLQQYSNSHRQDDCLKDLDLPRMDIGEIEDVNGDWLA